MSKVQMKILVVSDDTLVKSALVRRLRRSGQEAEGCGAGEARARFQEQAFSVVLLDVKDLSFVFGFLQELRKQAATLVPAILVVVNPTEAHRMTELVRKGAYDVLMRPLDLSELQAKIEQMLETSTVKERLKEATKLEETTLFVAESAAMKEVVRIVKRVAQASQSSVMLLGESGVGKEKVAELIHLFSPRKNGPFVQVNMAALLDTMIEAELFGHTKGAFTGATKARPGLLARANGGTLLLDELVELRIDLQPKLLRFLQERCYFPVGSDQEYSVDVRVLAATNRDPEEAIRKGLLREDLYYRLNTIIIEIPPLRERIEDILPLANCFIQSYTREMGYPPLRLSQEACHRLLEHDWRGNVRELRNVVERAIILAEGGEIQASDLGLFPSKQKIRIDIDTEERRLSTVLNETERARIFQALQETNGDMVRAAHLLGISRSTLYAKCKRFGIGRGLRRMN